MSSLLLLLFIIIIAIIIITIIIIICQFRSPSPRSYNAAFIPTLNKIWYVFEKRTSCVVNYNKNLKGCKNCVLYVSKKIQETNIGLSNWSFFLVFFSLFLPCSLFFIRTFWLSLEQQSGRGHASISIKYQ